jgi:nucleoside-diphosphate-sugar epimerase
MNIFIVGITGRTGKRIAELLIKQGHTVAGLYRREGEGSKLLEMGVQGVAGDIATITERELAEAIAGSEVVVFAAGAGEQDAESMIDEVDYGGVKKAIAALHLVGQSRLLLVSVFPEASCEECLGEPFEHYMSAKKRLTWML